MPLSRSPRTDRRRRTMRENLSVYTDGSDEARVSPSRTARNAEIPELTKKDRGAAYSHSVRSTCQQRVVQFIPVRKISLVGAVAASAAIPLLLVVLHYLVFVSGTLDWSGHPMSALLNANSPRSLAAWMCSHLWLLCLATTVLTFRLRKHKLDDYDGDYRLWFWLVFTCLIGSVDSTTRLTELFGAALDRWSQLHVGWSGVAIVSATLATLVGLLGLRLCSELKAVPTSLVLWLVGLLCWAGSAALSQSIFHLEMSAATRAWLRASLWLGGLTSIWLCSLYYLRATFMDAQKRFLSRALANSQSVPWQQRLREAMPKMPQLPRFGRAKSEEDLEDAEQATTKRKKRIRPVAEPTDDEDQEERGRADDRQPDRSSERRDTARPVAANSAREDRQDLHEPAQTSPTKRGWGFGLGKLALRPPAQSASGSSASSDNAAPRSSSAQDAEVDREYGKKSGWFGRRQNVAAKEDQPDKQRSMGSTKQRGDNETDEVANNKRSLRDRFSWKRKELTAEQVAEREAKQAARQKSRASKANDDSGEEGQSKRSWLRMPKPKLPKISLPKPKLPKFKLPSFRLPPPTDSGNASSSSSRTQVPNVDASRPLPSTSNQRPNAVQQDQDQDQDDNYRNMSKAERKRLKRMQRDDEGDRRAA